MIQRRTRLRSTAPVSYTHLEFQFALTLTASNSNRTLPIALYYFKSQFASNYGAMFAATILVIIPSIIVYIALQEQVVSGLSAGAVKA